MNTDDRFMDYQIGRKNVILEKDYEAYEKIQNEMLKSHNASLAERKREEEKFYAELKKIRELGEDDPELEQRYRKSVEARKAAEQDLADAKLAIQEDLNKKVEVATINSYKNMSARERREYSKNVAERLSSEIKFLDVREKQHNKDIEKLEERAKSEEGEAREKTEKEIAEKKAKLKEIQNSKLKLQGDKDQAEAQSIGFTQASLRNGLNFIGDKTGVNFNVNHRKAALEEAQREAAEKAKIVEDHNKEQEEYRKKIEDAEKRGDKEEMERLEEIRRAKAEAFEEEGALEAAQEAETNLKKEQAKMGIATIFDDLSRGMDNLVSDYKAKMTNVKEIDKYLDDIFGNQAKYLAKLEGSNEKWRESVNNISEAVGFSGVVKKTSVISKMKDLVDSGIAYNIELRAFLAETSANIASTFEVTNGTLLRMIRLQQQDSTAARLGMEATLTRLFNQFFEDNSYLKDVSDNISSAILDASATMSRNMSLEFEYAVQKWLGSLYSIGVSSESLSKIAEGVNYLGTGNVSALNSNSALQTLFAMSASRTGGKSYAQMLTSGITAEDTNLLLKEMIKYLAEIANSQSNMVTKSAYAELFGMSVTDLSTFANLTQKEINQLYESTVNYDSLLEETSNRLSNISKNMSLTELINNSIDNALTGVATTIGSTAFTYGTWKALRVLKSYVGEIKVPGITGMGTGFSSEIDLLNVAEQFMVGLGLVGSLVSGLGSLVNGGPTNLSNWDFNEMTQRGERISQGLDKGVTTNTSYSAILESSLGTGSGSASDAESVSMESTTEKGMEASGTTSEEMEEQKEIPKKIYDAIEGENDVTIISLLQEIDDRLDPNRVFYTAIAGVLAKDHVTSINNLSSQLSVNSASVSADENDLANNQVTSNTTASTNSLSGQGINSETPELESMSDLIATAVSEAIRNAVSSYGMSGLPVNITNGGY